MRPATKLVEGVVISGALNTPLGETGDEGVSSPSRHPRANTSIKLLVVLLSVYAAVYGWILVSTGFMPYVMDNNESFSVLVHASNMYRFSFWKSFGLTDEAYGPAPAAHPFIHTHQGNMPRLFGFLIYALGARSIESQIFVTTATIGTLSLVLMYLYFVKLGGPGFAFICSALLITDYIQFVQWQVDTYRVWYSFLFFLILLAVHEMSGRRRRLWKCLMAGAYLLLFYSELVFAAWMALFCVLYTLTLYRRKLPLAREIIAIQVKAAAAAIAILFIQLSLVFGPSVVIQDFRLTFFSRNNSGGLATQRLKEFFNLHNIVYWDNIFDVTSFKNHIELIRSQTHFNFQVYTPILTLLFVTLLLGWLFSYWRIAVKAAGTLRGADSFRALPSCWFAILIAVAPWALAEWLQSGEYLNPRTVVGALVAAVLACVILRYAPAAIRQLSLLRAEDPVRVNSAIRLAGILCTLFLLLESRSALASSPIADGSAALLLATRAFYLLVLLGMAGLIVRPGLIFEMQRMATRMADFSGAIDHQSVLRKTAVASVVLLSMAVLALRLALAATMRIFPWFTLYLVFLIPFVVLFCYWKIWTRPFLRPGSLLRTASPDTVRFSAAIASSLLIPFAVPLLEARVEGALIFRSYTIPYFAFLCMYAAVCFALVRCALNPDRAFRWLRKPNLGDASAQTPFLGGERWESRFCAAAKAAIIFFLLFYVLVMVVEGQNAYGTTPIPGASIWTFPMHALLLLFLAAAGTLAAARLGGQGWMDFGRLPSRLVTVLAIYLFAIGNFIQHAWEWYEQGYSAVWMEAAKIPDLNLLGKLAVVLAVALGMWMILVGRRRVLDRTAIKELQRVGLFFLLGELAYVVIYWLSPGYVLTGYQWRHAPLTVFLTCVLPAAAVYILFLVASRAWKELSQGEASGEVVDLRRKFDRMLPRFTGAAAAVVAAFVCIYWAVLQTTYVRLLPPDHFSFLKTLRQPPYQGKSFVVTTYAAPVAAMTGAWAYFDPLMTTGWKRTPRSYEVPRDTRYLWLADRWNNKAYQRPDYYACMLGQNLPQVAARLNNPSAPPSGCSVQGLVHNVTQANTPAIDYQLMGTSGSESDSWAIVKLDYDYPPYLEQLGPDLKAGVNLSMEKTGDRTLRPRVEYGFQQVSGAQEGNSLLELYASENSDCDSESPQWQRIYSGPLDHVLSLPTDFTGTLQAFVTPRTASKQGWRFHSAVMHIKEGDLPSFGACSAQTPDPPSGLHAFRIDRTTIELNWRSVPGTVRYRVEMAGGDGPMQKIGESQTNSGGYTIGNAQVRMTYRFRVTACDATTGACSWPTPTATEEKPRDLTPEPVTELHAYRLSSATAYLEWSPASYARDYFVEMRVKGGKFEKVDRLDPKSNHEWIEDLQPQREYSFRVRACRQNDCAEYSDEFPIGRNATLIPPARFRATRRDPAVAVLSWEGDAGVDLYRIDMATGQSGEFAQIGTVTGRRNYTVQDLGPASSYRFRIRSCLHPEGPCSSYSPIAFSAAGQ